jgi:hypothetical protein
MYVDASYMSHSDTKGHSGGVIYIGDIGTFISAYSRKQKLITRSSTESELVAIDEVSVYAKFVAKLVRDLTNSSSKIYIMEDNMSAISMVTNGESNNLSTKHIDKRYYMIKEQLDSGEAVIQYLPTEDMVADFYTNPMTGEKFTKFADMILGGRFHNPKDVREDLPTEINSVFWEHASTYLGEEYYVEEDDIGNDDGYWPGYQPG